MKSTSDTYNAEGSDKAIDVNVWTQVRQLFNDQNRFGKTVDRMMERVEDTVEDMENRLEHESPENCLETVQELQKSSTALRATNLARLSDEFEKELTKGTPEPDRLRSLTKDLRIELALVRNALKDLG